MGQAPAETGPARRKVSAWSCFSWKMAPSCSWMSKPLPRIGRPQFAVLTESLKGCSPSPLQCSPKAPAVRIADGTIAQFGATRVPGGREKNSF